MKYFSGKRRPSDSHGSFESVPDVPNESSNGASQFEQTRAKEASPNAGKVCWNLFVLGCQLPVL